MKEFLEYVLISIVTAVIFFGGIELLDLYIDKPLAIFLYIVINSLLIKFADREVERQNTEAEVDN